MSSEDSEPEDNAALDGVLREYARTAGPGDDERFIEGVNRRLADIETSERDWPWVFGRNFWKVAAVIALLFAAGVGGKSFLIHNAEADPTEVYVFTQPRIEQGERATLRILVRDARLGEPLAEAKVKVTIAGSGSRKRLLGEARTDKNGICDIDAELADDLEEGEYTIRVAVRASTGRAAAEQTVTIARTYRTMLSTDKPLYQPGQVIHMRALSLGSDNLLPATGRKVAFEVRDAKGNKVFRRSLETSDFGIAAADFKLANQVNEGSYTIAVTVGDTTSERTVKVERYTLPRFRVDLATGRNFYGPEDSVNIDLDANYTFGKPVMNADVVIHAEQFVEKFRPFHQLRGKTDANGRIHFELPLRDAAFIGQPLNRGDAFVRLRAEVTDATGERRQQTKEITVTNSPLRVDIFPESGELVRGVVNTLYFVATYADGSPARVRIVADKTTELHTNDLGIGKMALRPDNRTTSLAIVAVDEKSGARLSTSKNLRIGAGEAGILLRPDRAVYRQGETANLTVLSATPARRVFLDVVKDGRSFATSTIDIAAGMGTHALDLPLDLAGTLQLQAYAILPNGEIARDTKLIQVHRAQHLLIEANLDAETYRPGEKAMIQFLVKTKNGDPVEAALSLSAVDEAVFALNDARPGLEEMYFLIQEELLKLRYQLTAFPQLAIDANPQEVDPLVDESNRIAMAGSIGADAGPGKAAGESLGSRVSQVADAKAESRLALVRQLALVPFVLLLVLVAIFMAYGISRILVVPGGTGECTYVAEFRRNLLKIFLSLVATVIGIPLILIIFEGDGPAGIFIVALLFATPMFMLFFTGCLRRAPHVRRHLPLFRKVIGLVPAIYCLCGFVFAGLLLALRISWDSVSPDLAETLGVVSIGALLLTAALVLFLRGSLSRARTLGRNAISLAASIAAVVVVPLLLFLPEASPFTVTVRQDSEGMDLVMNAMPAVEMSGDNPDDDPGESQAPAAGRIRRYFPETLLWRPQLVTGADGRAQLEVELADSITTWRLAGSAVSRSGGLASFEQGIRVFQDFFIDIDFPTQLTQNDEIAAPVAIFNYLDEPQTIQLEAQAGDWFEFVDDAPSKTLQLGAGEISNTSFRIRALKPGRHVLMVSARGTKLSDAVERTVRVEPDGERVEQVVNGRLIGDTRVSVDIPEDAIEGGSDLYLKVYPGAFSQVVEGMDSIFQMPNGCFEQTSSTTYPNVLVLNYLQETKQTKPEIEMKALDFIAQGYQRLVSYEVEGGGFDWFGNPPANTILTAYGLMEFVDMAKVYDVDQALIERTRAWLLAQRNRDGSFTPPQGGIAEGAINRFQDNEAATLKSTAYIAWAIASADVTRELAKTFDFLAREAAGIDDPYTLALCANTFAAAGYEREAQRILKQLDSLAKQDGDLVWWESAGTGATHSRGDSLAIETTALVAQAMIQTSHEIGTAHKALAWLISQRDGRGTWFSTQATVQSMRALLLGATSASKLENEVTVKIFANRAATNPLAITEENADVFHLVSLTEHVRPGANELALQLDAKANLAFQLVAVHYEPRDRSEPRVEPKQILEIETEFSITELATDDLVKVEVTLRYNRPEAAPMTLVDLGIPPGFEIDTASFEQLLKTNAIQRFDSKGRQVTLYFDSIPGDGKDVTFEYALRAKFPVKAKVPPSTAYQYYEPEIRDESESIVLTVE